MPAFDPRRYQSLPSLDAAESLALAEALAAAAPDDPPLIVLKSLDKMRVRAESLAAAWARPRETVDRRPADTWLDNAWGAIDDRLAAYARLTRPHPDSDRAAGIRQTLFPDGLTFTQLKLESEWAESEKRIGQIDGKPGGQSGGTEPLADDLARLVGALFVDELRAAHRHFGEVLGITRPPAKTSEAGETGQTSVLESMRALHDAIRNYARKIIGHVDEDSHDSVVHALEALRPLADARDRADRAAGPDA